MHKNWKPVIDRLNSGVNPESILEELYYGVEIEFSDAGDLGREECPYDEDSAAESLNDQGADLLAHLFGESDNSAYRVYREMLRHSSLEDIIDSCTRHSWSTLVDNELEAMRENWECNGDSGEFRDVSGWEHCEDGTSGIVQEYKTSHPCRYAEMRTRIQRLFDEAGSFHVPKNGSCHVHVSLPGVKHQTNTSDGDTSYLHCCILYELSQCAGLIPECVYDRIDHDSHWFELNEGPNTKYTAVRFHPQGSIEFRLFGHCNSTSEAMECVKVAGIAFLRGYARYFAKAYEIKDVREFRDAFKDAIEQRQPMLSSLIQTFMPMADILCASVSRVYGNCEESAVSQGILNWVDEYRNPWQTDSELLWSAPQNYVCELRNGQRITLAYCESDGGYFYDSSLSEEQEGYAYGPSVNGLSCWQDSEDANDIIRFRLRTISSASTVSPMVDMVSAMSQEGVSCVQSI